MKQGKILHQIDIGNTVVCDCCSKDFTDSDECGGFIMTGRGVCPDCEPRMRMGLKKYNEEDHIISECPPGMSHREFILRARGGNNKITLYEIEK